MRLFFAIVVSMGLAGCAALVGAGLGGAGGFVVAGPPGAAIGAGAGAVGGAVGSRMRWWPEGDQLVLKVGHKMFDAFLAFAAVTLLLAFVWLILD